MIGGGPLARALGASAGGDFPGGGGAGGGGVLLGPGFRAPSGGVPATYGVLPRVPLPQRPRRPGQGDDDQFQPVADDQFQFTDPGEDPKQNRKTPPLQWRRSPFAPIPPVAPPGAPRGPVPPPYEPPPQGFWPRIRLAPLNPGGKPGFRGYYPFPFTGSHGMPIDTFGPWYGPPSPPDPTEPPTFTPDPHRWPPPEPLPQKPGPWWKWGPDGPSINMGPGDNFPFDPPPPPEPADPLGFRVGPRPPGGPGGAGLLRPDGGGCPPTTSRPRRESRPRTAATGAGLTPTATPSTRRTARSGGGVSGAVALAGRGWATRPSGPTRWHRRTGRHGHRMPQNGTRRNGGAARSNKTQASRSTP